MAIHTTTIVAVSPNGLRSVAWISIADTGDISTGLTDRGVVFASPGGDRDGSRNPHFTFHPPIYHHLRTGGNPELLAALMEVDLMLNISDIVPWVRLTSRPYANLREFERTRQGTDILNFSIQDERASVQLELDFVRPHGSSSDSEFIYKDITEQMALRLAIRPCPPTNASLSLLWQG